MQRLLYAFALLLSITGFSDAIQASVTRKATKNSMKSETWPLPSLVPVESSFFSTDANQSAGFILGYFANTRLVSSSSFESGKKIVVVEMCRAETCFEMRFVEDSTAPTGSISPSAFIKDFDEDWDRVGSAALQYEVDFSPWVDYHLGLNGDDFNAERAIQDGMLIQTYDRGGVFRIAIPNTWYTLELMMSNQSKYKSLVKYSGVSIPETCRENDDQFREDDRMDDSGSWWKSTYSAHDPLAAAEFVVHALGAQRVTSPFVEGVNCTIAEWVVLPLDPVSSEEEANETMPPPDSNYPPGLMLHFVNNDAAYGQGDYGTKTLANHVGTLRDLASNIFDRYMYTFVTLRAESLDTFVARFQEIKEPFLVRNCSGDFGLYVSVPGNSIVLKISSSEAPSAFDSIEDDEACSD